MYFNILASSCNQYSLPHQVLLSNVRNHGNCPACPWCLVAKYDIHKMGQVLDIHNCLSRAQNYTGDLICWAQDFIYNLGKNVASTVSVVLMLMDPHIGMSLCVNLAKVCSAPSQYFCGETQLVRV